MESKLAYLMRTMSPEHKRKLWDMLGCSESTWYRWQRNPGTMPLKDVVRIKDFLDRRDREDYDMRELAKAVHVGASRRTVAVGIRKGRKAARA